MEYIKIAIYILICSILMSISLKIKTVTQISVYRDLITDFESRNDVLVYEIKKGNCKDLKLEWGQTKQQGSYCFIYGPQDLDY